MNSWLHPLNLAAEQWAEAITRACWQGGIALLVVWLVCRLRRRMSPAVQCWLWRMAYAKLLVAALVSTPIDVPLLAPIPLRPVAVSAHAPETATVEAPPAVVRPGSRGPLPSAAVPIAGPLTGSPAPAPTPLLAQMVAWLAVACWLGSRMTWEARAAQRLRSRCGPARDRSLHLWLTELAAVMGVRRLPELLESDVVPAPMLLIGRPPAIALPPRLLDDCSAAECRLILAHELAHVRRGDLAWGWLPAFVTAALFFHPLVWFARREYDLTQEMACDSLALSATGSPTAAYGELLLKAAALPRAGIQSGLASLGGADASVHALRRRLRMLQLASGSERSKVASAQPRARVGGLALAMLGLFVLAPWRVTAREAPLPPALPPGAEASALPAAESGAGDQAPVEKVRSEIAVAANRRSPAAAEAPSTNSPPVRQAPVPDAGKMGTVAEQWEDVLLLEALRYLRVNPTQLQHLDALARPVDERLEEVRDNERRTLSALERIAQQNKRALLTGAPGRRQDDALLLKRAAQQKRATTEHELVEWILPRLMKILAREQQVRAIMLTIGEPVKDRDRAFGIALLDPAAGFVLVRPEPETRPDAIVKERIATVKGRWARGASEQARQALAQRYPADVLRRLPGANLSDVLADIGLNFTSPRLVAADERLDAAKLDNGVLATEAQLRSALREYESLRSRAELPVAQVLLREATDDELRDALRPFARRLMLSPRLGPLLKERAN